MTIDERIDEQEHNSLVAEHADDVVDAELRPQRYSRRDAARFHATLEATRAELAEERAMREQRAAQDAAALEYVQQRLGTDEMFAALGQLKVGGYEFSPEQEQLYASMAGLRQVAGLLFAAAREQVLSTWGSAFEEVLGFEGMSDELRQQVNVASEPLRALVAIYAAGVSKGEQRSNRAAVAATRD